MKPKHDLHRGEVYLQKLRGTPSEVTASMPNFIDRDLPQQHADFFSSLSYLPLAALDRQGRPWASILITMSGTDPSVGVLISRNNQIDIVAETNPYDPFIRALGPNNALAVGGRRLFAGVGVDFTNRRRNKIAGVIGGVDIDPVGKVSMRLHSDQHLGNCPKYITVRSVEHETRNAEVILDSLKPPASPLPEDAKSLLERASTVFLATKHTAKDEKGLSDEQDMGLNHRGGAPGFVRLYEEEGGGTVTTYLVVPDHSGNRFYQSLGNIETDKQVGLVIPDFTTGDVLYVTGDAENLCDAEAEAIMPRTGLLTRVKITGVIFVRGGLNLRLVSEEQYSPYNPPVRFLRRELEEMGHAPDSFDTSDPVGATLVSTQRLSENISTFSFELSSAVDAVLPGGLGIFDFSKVLDAGYRHMSEANPQLVNEDYVRTWTLSSAPPFDAETNQFQSTNRVSVTVKRKPGGLMSNFLHDHADRLIERQVKVGFKGTGAGFSCFAPDNQGGPPGIPSKMLWIAGGVGTTPFMTMWDGIVNVASTQPKCTVSDILLLFSGNDDDLSVLKHFSLQDRVLPAELTFRVVAFQTAGRNSTKAQLAVVALANDFSDAQLRVEQRRMQTSDFSAVEDLAEREIFVCGPDSLMRFIDSSLDELGIDKAQLHQESFVF